MKVGYIRVSKQEQNETLQKDALQEAGCEKYFSDKITGSKFERKGLEDLLAFVRSGDRVIVWKLDRLGRSLRACFGVQSVESMSYTSRHEKDLSKQSI